MAVTMMRQDLAASFADVSEPWQPSNIHELTRADEAEVLEFLSERPLHTIFMTGLIRDNGLASPRNRGSFYGSRRRSGELEGVALIGHATLVETHRESALMSFARIARNCHDTHLVRGEQGMSQAFWRHFSETGHEPRLVCSEQLLELNQVAPPVALVDGLRKATVADVEKVLSINSSLAFEEGGVNPTVADPNGFRARTLQRIEKGRVWVWIRDGRLMFKTDVVSQTSDAAYLEGVYVNAEERRQGHGQRCLRQLCENLLHSSKTICLTVNEQNKAALAMYSKVGFHPHSQYETIYLR